MRPDIKFPSFPAWRRRVAAASDRLQRLLPPKFSAQDQIFFAQRLAFLIDGDVSILDGLRILGEQVRSRGCARVIDAVRDDVANGRTLSASLGKFPAAFEEVAITLIRVGETCGLLSRNLHHLADELKKRRQLRRKIFGALLYPALVAAATLGITVFLTVYLLPKLTPIFLSMNMDLPASTRAVIGVSAFLRKRGFMVLAALAAFVVACVVAARRSARLRGGFARHVLKVPLIGRLVQYHNLAHFGRAAGLMLGSGMTLRDTLATHASMSGNVFYKRHFQAMSETVDRGERVSAYLRRYPKLFPDLFSQMIAVGEHSGKLSDAFLYLSEFYEREVDDSAKEMSDLIEPLLMIGTGALVGFIALAVISPMYAITRTLHV